MNNKELISIKLKFVPFNATFRHDHTWWYHIPPGESPENAVETRKGKDIRIETIPNDTIVAAHLYEVPTSVASFFGKFISLS